MIKETTDLDILIIISYRKIAFQLGKVCLNLRSGVLFFGGARKCGSARVGGRDTRAAKLSRSCEKRTPDRRLSLFKLSYINLNYTQSAAARLFFFFIRFFYLFLKKCFSKWCRQVRIVESRDQAFSLNPRGKLRAQKMKPYRVTESFFSSSFFFFFFFLKGFIT